ncbi:uncharacterized mitochondrial protein AtMg00810-like [Gossypium arboreum]|uniref:uncharacterized mitochondrial protein AtMg00810-like n=1 Tax=Gossypium arboreum TaxID=29729 RepID=UPI0022F1B547|nr:uncharacterized mitochondrial protein AtMg00810-like [Gossypium arboreum]
MAQSEKSSSISDYEKVDEREYRSVIGCLLYLTATRPDLMHAIGLLARFMHCSNMVHFKVAKRVLRYIKGTLRLGVLFKKEKAVERQKINQAIWLRKLLCDLNEEQLDATEILVDNQSAVAIAKNPYFMERPSISKSSSILFEKLSNPEKLA